MKIEIVVFLAMLLLVRCQNDDKVPDSKSDVIVDLVIDTNTINQIIEEKIDPQHQKVIDAATNFFSWYYSNGRKLIKKREEIVAVADGYYVLDNRKLIKYTDWLRQSGYFSSQFIENEIYTWKDDCGEQLNQLMSQEIMADGPPPCTFEADPFFYTQEQVDEGMIQKIEYKIEKYSDTLSVVSYDYHLLEFLIEDSSWKVNDWAK